MTDVLDSGRDHYRATGLAERLRTVTAALGPEDQRVTPQQLGALSFIPAVSLRPPSLPSWLALPTDFAALVANLGRNLMHGRLGILTAVFAAAPVDA